MLNNTGHQGNANQNQNERPLHNRDNDYNKNQKLKWKLTSVGKDVEKLTLIYCWWDCETVQLLWKIVWQFFKKIKCRITYDLAISLLDIYPKERKTVTQANTYTGMLLAALITVAKNYQNVYQWINGQTVEYHSGIKGNECVLKTIF